MNALAVLDWIDDRLNPIVVKELRQAVKNRAVTTALLVLLAGLMAVTVLTIYENLDDKSDLGTLRSWRPRDSGEIGTSDPEQRTGRVLVQILQPGLLTAFLVVIPLQAAIRLHLERCIGHGDLLFIAGLRASAIVRGKLLTSLVLALLVFSCCLPFLTFAYLLGGLDVLTLVMVLWIDLLAGLMTTQFALFVGAIRAPLLVKLLVGAYIMGLLLLLAGPLIGGALLLTQEGFTVSAVGAVVGVSVIVPGLVVALHFGTIDLINPKAVQDHARAAQRGATRALDGVTTNQSVKRVPEGDIA
jgi:hypothetical protein